MTNNPNEHHFHWKVETSKGTVNVRAEAVIRENTLSFQDFRVRPEGQNKTGLNSEMQAVKSELMRRAKEQGFTRLEISAERVPGSTSAKPGKTVDFSVDLTKGEREPVTAFQAHSDPVIRHGQEVNRLQALQKTYQTRQALDIAKSKQKGFDLSKAGQKGNDYE